jgi:hypothetical protein
MKTYFEKNAKYNGTFYSILCPNGYMATADNPRQLRDIYEDNLVLGIENKFKKVTMRKNSIEK